MIEPQPQLLLHLLGCDLQGLALGGASPPVHLDSRVKNISPAQQDAEGAKEVVRGPNNELDDNKGEEIVVCSE